MLQGIYGARSVSSVYGLYGAHRSAATGYIGRAASGGSVEPIGPLAGTSAVTAPFLVQSAGKEAALAQPQALGGSDAAVPATKEQPIVFSIPDAANNKYTAPEMAVRGRIRPFEDPATIEQSKGAKPEQAIQMGDTEQLDENSECQTCKERKYQDESDDASVSFQSPQSIASSAVAATVRGHEMEHVHNERAKAAKEGRKVVSQTVTLHSAICPDCGETYISGGTTRTVTMADNNKAMLERQAEQDGAEENDPFLANMRFPA